MHSERQSSPGRRPGQGGALPSFAPLGSAALPGLPAVLLEIFVHFMAEFQGHFGSTGFLQALHS